MSLNYPEVYTVDHQVGRRLKLARDLSGISAADAAMAAGLSITEYDEVEHGDRRLHAIEMEPLLRLLHRSPNWLLAVGSHAEWIGLKGKGRST